MDEQSTFYQKASDCSHPQISLFLPIDKLLIYVSWLKLYSRMFICSVIILPNRAALKMDDSRSPPPSSLVTCTAFFFSVECLLHPLQTTASHTPALGVTPWGKCYCNIGLYLVLLQTPQIVSHQHQISDTDEKRGYHSVTAKRNENLGFYFFSLSLKRFISPPACVPYLLNLKRKRFFKEDRQKRWGKGNAKEINIRSWLGALRQRVE